MPETTAQCDERCHDENRDDCALCCSGEWEQMCDACRSYAADDGEADR